MSPVPIVASFVLSVPVGVLLGSGQIVAGLVVFAAALTLFLLWGWYWCSYTAAYRRLARQQRRRERTT